MAGPVIDVKIKGIRELDSGMRRLASNILEAVPRDAVKPTADQSAATTRNRVPKRTGRLAASVHVAERDGVAQVQMGGGLPYARWIEYGGGHGRPFRKSGRYVLPVARRTARSLKKYAEAAVDREIKGMHW